MASDPVTVRIAEDDPHGYEWEVCIGLSPCFSLPMGEGGFASYQEALDDALDTLRTLAAALRVGVRYESGEPLYLDE